MRAGAFGWRGSAKTIDRLSLAKSEIRAVYNGDRKKCCVAAGLPIRAS